MDGFLRTTAACRAGTRATSSSIHPHLMRARRAHARRRAPWPMVGSTLHNTGMLLGWQAAGTATASAPAGRRQQQHDTVHNAIAYIWPVVSYCIRRRQKRVDDVMCCWALSRYSCTHRERERIYIRMNLRESGCLTAPKIEAPPSLQDERLKSPFDWLSSAQMGGGNFGVVGSTRHGELRRHSNFAQHCALCMYGLRFGLCEVMCETPNIRAGFS